MRKRSRFIEAVIGNGRKPCGERDLCDFGMVAEHIRRNARHVVRKHDFRIRAVVLGEYAVHNDELLHHTGFKDDFRIGAPSRFVGVRRTRRHIDARTCGEGVFAYRRGRFGKNIDFHDCGTILESIFRDCRYAISNYNRCKETGFNGAPDGRNLC